MELQNKDVQTFSRSVDMVIDNEDERTVKISVSSEEPYLRSFGYEVLSHAEGDVNLDFFKSSNAPVLSDHNHKHQIGVVKSAWVADNKLHAVIKISKNHLDVLTDIKDGIKNNISVGYEVTAMEEDGTLEDIPVFKCKFRPYECSVVAVPADETVGTNRAKESEEDPQIVTKADPEVTIEVKSNETIVEADPKVSISEKTDIKNIDDKLIIEQQIKKDFSKMETKDLEVNNEDVLKAERSRVNDIQDLAKRFNVDGTDYIKNCKSVAEFKDFVLDSQEDTRTVSVAPAVHIKKDRVFSLGKAFIAAGSGNWDGKGKKDAGYEREMSQEGARRSGKAFTGNNFFVDPNMQVRANSVTGGAGLGVETVATELRSDRFIDLLYAETFSGKLGVDKMLGLTGFQSIPRLTSTTDVTWEGETGPKTVESNLGFALDNLSPKQIMGKTKITRQILTMSDIQIEQKVRTAMLRSIALKVDETLITGTGVGNIPTGILNTAGIGSIGAAGLGVNGGAPTYAKLLELISSTTSLNVAEESLGWLFNTKTESKFRGTLKDAANTASGYILDENSSTLIGLPYVISNLVPSNLSKGTSTTLSPVIVGTWYDAMHAQWGDIEMTVDPFSAGDTSEIITRTYSFWDMGVKRAESFAVIKDLDTTFA